jgi:hypothetical protein
MRIQTPLITLSERIYRALLIFYPADYRHEYGALMVQVFRDVSRDTYRSQGVFGLLFWWCAALLDLTRTVIEQRKKVTMSKSTWIQITGSLLVIGGAFWGLAAFSQLQPGDHYTYHGVYQVLIWLLAPGFLLVGLGCVGLALRYGPALGVLGKWLLYLTSLGALVMAVGLVAMSIQDSLWNIWLAGGILHMTALIVFGLLHVWKPVLPIFRALPLQIASGWLIVMTGVFVRLFPQATANLLSFLMVFGMGLAWLAIGLAVHRQQSKVVPAAA